MVIDTSALVAILTGEPERTRFIATLEAAESCCLSAGTYVESSIVIDSRYGSEGLRDLDLFLATAGADVVPLDRDQALVARRAYSRFGKGRHRAALNFGDCFAYALALTRAETLLFKGSDFNLTDVIPAEVVS
jgi:ribonuclease VapC